MSVALILVLIVAIILAVCFMVFGWGIGLYNMTYSQINQPKGWGFSRRSLHLNPSVCGHEKFNVASAQRETPSNTFTGQEICPKCSAWTLDQSTKKCSECDKDG